MRSLRYIAYVALALFALAALLRWVVRGRTTPPGAQPGAPPLRPGARHSFELRCEAHRLTVRLEADGAEEFERSRVQLRCPLCAQTRAGGND